MFVFSGKVPRVFFDFSDFCGVCPFDWGKHLQGRGFLKNAVLSEQCGTSRTCAPTLQELLGNYITLHTPPPNIDKCHVMWHNGISSGVMF